MNTTRPMLLLALGTRVSTGVSGQATQPQTQPGGSYTVHVTLSSAPPTGTYTVTATVERVPGETTVTHNTQTFSITFH